MQLLLVSTLFHFFVCLLFVCFVCCCCCCCCLPAAPDPPVLKSAVTSDPSSLLLVSWWKLNCQNINSDRLYNYIVRYGNMDVGQLEASVDAQQSSARINVSQILPFTEYSLAVAARSSEGLGNYSASMMAVILRGKGREGKAVGLRSSPCSGRVQQGSS